MARYEDWSKRVYFPTPPAAPLGFFAETWADLSAHPAQEWLAEEGHRPGSDMALYHLTHELVPSVVYAAGGVEHALGPIEAAMRAAQSARDEHIALPNVWPEHGVGMSHPAILEATWELTHFVWWTRALEERVDRASSGRGKPTPRLGLLPSLNPGRSAKEQVASLLNEYRRRTLGDARALANYTAHVGGPPNPSHANIQRDGQVSWALPDRFVRAQVSAQLTYKEGRELLGFARKVFEEVVSFVELLLAILESDYSAIVRERDQPGDSAGAADGIPAAPEV